MQIKLYTNIIMFLSIGVLFHSAAVGQENVTNELTVLMKVSSIGPAASNKLVQISKNKAVSSDLRQLASKSLKEHDGSGTNSYKEIESFAMNWTLTNEPSISFDTIIVLKEAVELGVSAMTHLISYASDTNVPPALRNVAGVMVKN